VQENLQCALKDPTYKPTVQQAELFPRLNIMHDIAQSHLARLEDKCAKTLNRVTHFQGSPAAICVENMADKVVNLINECHKTALQKPKVCYKNLNHWQYPFYTKKNKQLAEVLM